MFCVSSLAQKASSRLVDLRCLSSTPQFQSFQKILHLGYVFTTQTLYVYAFKTCTQKSYGAVFYLWYLSLSLNNPISLRSNERHERPCCCFDKYFKIASRLLPHFSNLFETTRAICRGFKTSALLWTNPLTKYFLFLLDQKLLECSSCLTLESL